MKKQFNKKAILFLLLGMLIISIFLFLKFSKRSFEISNQDISESKEKDIWENKLEKGKNPITGLFCENYNRRFFAVMLAEDPITRPLSGISFADLVIEMPVITGSITRMMAVFGCESPTEIGSVRSARHDFIPLAMGLDAIYAHWGGSHFALDKLNAGIMDNIDALKNPYNAFWRKSDKPAPHNGFTSIARLENAAEKLGYRLINKFEGYPHLEKFEPAIKTKAKLTIGYSGHYKVHYIYDPKTNSYKRWRDGAPEVDKINQKQVEVQNVVIMWATSRQIEGPYYNDVDIEGTGGALIYRNGEEIEGTWEKKGFYKPTKLYFFDKNGNEIKFVPGKIWIEIVEPYQEVKWELLQNV